MLTALIILAGMLIGVRLRLPAGTFLGPLLLGVAAEEAGLFHVMVPDVVSLLAYALIGVYAGLLFNSDSAARARRLMPCLLASTLALMAACAGLGWLLATLMDLDYLTAYLATTPGAIDSISIMAVDSAADSSLVLSIQMLRLMAVILVGSLLGLKLKCE